MEHEKRSVARVRVPGGLPGEVSVLAPAEIRDFSERGATLDTAFPLVLNSIHDIRLELDDRSVIVKGRVAHCSIAELGGELVRYRAGFEFVDPTPHAASAIRAYLDGIARRRAADTATRPPGEPTSP
jgi:hypothetical protein